MTAWALLRSPGRGAGRAAISQLISVPEPGRPDETPCIFRETGADHARLTHTLKVSLLSLAILALAPLAPAELPYLRQLEASADAGEAEAQFILGLAYRDGWDGTVKSGTIAARWCALADELGDQRPAFVFTLLQRARDRVAKDEVRALRCLRDAAERGDDYARVILGELLLEGNGVPVDWRHGAEWIRKSAQAGFAPAQFRLGVIYLVGDAALPKDEIEALAWFIVAAEAGSKTAGEFRDERMGHLDRAAVERARERSRALRGKGD